jgi:MFS family permease
MREIFANRDMRRLLVAWTIHFAADWTLLVALLIVAYEAGGVAAVGLLGVVRMAFAPLVGPLAAAANRYPRERVLLAIHLGKTAATALIALALAAHGHVALIFVGAATVASASAVVRPIHLALLPALARTPGELVVANVATGTGEGIGTLIGPAIGGLLVVAAGPAATCATAAALFAVAALSVAPIRIPQVAAAQPVFASARFPLAAGIRALSERRGAAFVVGGFFAQTLVRGLWMTLGVAASIELLGLGQSGVGLLNSAIGAGGLVGGVAAIALVGGRRLGPAYAVALAAWGLPIALVAVWPQPVVALALMVIIGISNATLDVSGFTMLQRTVPNRDRVAVLGVFEGAVGLGVVVGSILAPILYVVFGISGALLVTGAILPVVAVLTWPRIGQLDQETVIHERELRLLQSIPMFVPLPLTAIEDLASRLVPVHFAAGDTLMREGESGDRFLIIAEGEVDVTQRGHPLRACGPGEGVGEIALLRATTRTASVTARTEVLAEALTSHDFLTVVCGFPSSDAVAQAVVAERLARSDATAERIQADEARDAP